MSKPMTTGERPDPQAIERGHEGVGVDTLSVARWGGVLFALLLVGMFLCYRLIAGFGSAPDPIVHDRADLGRITSQGAELDPRQPEKRRRLKREQSEKLNSYGWIDEEHGIARIPIDDAIDRFVAGETSDESESEDER